MKITLKVLITTLNYDLHEKNKKYETNVCVDYVNLILIILSIESWIICSQLNMKAEKIHYEWSGILIFIFDIIDLSLIKPYFMYILGLIKMKN